MSYQSDQERDVWEMTYEQFSAWFDREYGGSTPARKIGVVATALDYGKRAPFGADVSYITRKLDSILLAQRHADRNALLDEIEAELKAGYRIPLPEAESEASKDSFVGGYAFRENELLTSIEQLRKKE